MLSVVTERINTAKDESEREEDGKRVRKKAECHTRLPDRTIEFVKGAAAAYYGCRQGTRGMKTHLQLRSNFA